MKPTGKPAGLEPKYAAQFNDPSIVDAYVMRPPYPESLTALIVELAGGVGGTVLDLGCGTGELAATAGSVFTVDHSDR